MHEARRPRRAAPARRIVHVAPRGLARGGPARQVGGPRAAARPDADAGRSPREARSRPSSGSSPASRRAPNAWNSSWSFKKSGAAVGSRTASDRRAARGLVMTTITAHGARCGIGALCGALCGALDVSPATYYRAQQHVAVVEGAVTSPRPTPARALPPAERQQVLDVLHAPRFIDLAPAQVYATLLDEGIYHCSERTMYRVLAAQQEVRDRRAQRRHPHYTAPELLATAPNQLWSWDITKLKGPTTLVVVPLVRHPRRVQPLCGGLDGRAARIGGPRGALDHGQLRAAGDSPRPAHAPRRSRLVDALETGGLSRASVYYTPRAVADADLALMRRLDALHLECPFAGSRMLRDLLRGEDQVIGRDHARTLMRRMGITAIYRRPRTSARHPAHPVFPYLLRHRVIDRPEPGVGDRYHVHPHGARVRLPVCHHGLGHAQGVGVARVRHAHQ